MLKGFTKQRLKKGIKIALVIIVVLIIGWGVHLSWHSYQLLQLLVQLRDNPESIQVEAAGEIIINGADHINVIYKDSAFIFPVTDRLGWVPWLGPYLNQIRPLTTFADGLAQAGAHIFIGITPLFEDDESSGNGQPILQRAALVLDDGQLKFIKADHEINRAEEVRHLIHPELFPESIRPYYERLDDNFHFILAGGKILQGAPQLLGVDEPQQYLVLAQNRDELRATGGFISGIGLVNIHQGQIVQFNLGDSYDVDDFSQPYPQPPEPMHRFMLADYWVTRDSNWSPDFPTTAQQAQSLYTLSTGIETQGVIAFNQQALRAILQVIGPIQIEEVDETVSADNIEGYMAQAWGEGFGRGETYKDWHAHRKDFMKVLGDQILKQVMESGDQAQYIDLAKSLLYLLQSGQIQVYVDLPIVQQALQIAGLGGGLEPGDGDFLALVDSNVGFNKVDSSIKRSVSYHVDLREPKQPTSQIILSYNHMGNDNDQVCEQKISYGEGTYQDMQQRCYLNYWRLYVPGGSELIDQDTQPVPGSQLLNPDGWSGQVEIYPGENGAVVYAGLIMLPPQEEQQVKLTNDLPEWVLVQINPDQYRYRVRIQKQPGLVSMPINLEITLPVGAYIINQNQLWQEASNNTWLWQGKIDKTTDITAEFIITVVPE